MKRSLVPILDTVVAMAPLANDPIMLGRLLQSFKHLKHQNLSTGDEFIHSRGVIGIGIGKVALVLLVNDSIMSVRSIQLFRHLESQNLSIISDSIFS